VEKKLLQSGNQIQQLLVFKVGFSKGYELETGHDFHQGPLFFVANGWLIIV
jgi:hypothetical protein